MEKVQWNSVKKKNGLEQIENEKHKKSLAKARA